MHIHLHVIVRLSLIHKPLPLLPDKAAYLPDMVFRMDLVRADKWSQGVVSTPPAPGLLCRRKAMRRLLLRLAPRMT